MARCTWKIVHKRSHEWAAGRRRRVVVVRRAAAAASLARAPPPAPDHAIPRLRLFHRADGPTEHLLCAAQHDRSEDDFFPQEFRTLICRSQYSIRARVAAIRPQRGDIWNRQRHLLCLIRAAPATRRESRRPHRRAPRAWRRAALVRRALCGDRLGLQCRHACRTACAPRLDRIALLPRGAQHFSLSNHRHPCHPPAFTRADADVRFRCVPACLRACVPSSRCAYRPCTISRASSLPP